MAIIIIGDSCKFLMRSGTAKRGIYRDFVCLSVYMSVTFAHCIETVEHVISLFSPGSSLVLLAPSFYTVFQKKHVTTFSMIS